MIVDAMNVCRCIENADEGFGRVKKESKIRDASGKILRNFAEEIQ